MTPEITPEVTPEYMPEVTPIDQPSNENQGPLPGAGKAPKGRLKGE